MLVPDLHLPLVWVVFVSKREYASHPVAVKEIAVDSVRHFVDFALVAPRLCFRSVRIVNKESLEPKVRHELEETVFNTSVVQIVQSNCERNQHLEPGALHVEQSIRHVRIEISLIELRKELFSKICTIRRTVDVVAYSTKETAVVQELTQICDSFAHAIRIEAR